MRLAGSKTSLANPACPVVAALEVIDNWRTVVLLRDLISGLNSVDQFQRSTGIPFKALSDNLKHLEAKGLVTKVAYQKYPFRYQYSLTPRGRDLSSVVEALRHWGERWKPVRDT